MQNAHDYSQYMRKMRLFLVNDTGGKNNIARHFHYFEGGHKEREKEITIEADQRFKKWQTHMEESKPFILEQTSNLYVEAPIVKTMGLVGFSGRTYGVVKQDNLENIVVLNSIIYEIRRYQLKLGYETIPNFLDAYATGLPSKLNAEGAPESTALMSVLINDIG